MKDKRSKCIKVMRSLRGGECEKNTLFSSFKLTSCRPNLPHVNKSRVENAVYVFMAHDTAHVYLQFFPGTSAVLTASLTWQ